MEDNEYRGHSAIAQSDLSILTWSPYQFYKQKILGEPSNKTSSGFLVGNLVDTLVFEEGTFDRDYVLTPDDITAPYSTQEKLFCEFVLEGTSPKEAIRHLYGETDDTKIVAKAKDKSEKFKSYFKFISDTREKYTQSDLEVARACVQSIKNNSYMSDWFFSIGKYDLVYYQPVILFNYMGVECKAKLDALIVDKKNKIIYNIDLKTTGKSVSSFPYYYKQYGYHRQQYFYSMAALSFLKDKINLDSEWKIKTIVAVVETVYQHLAIPFAIPKNVMEAGKEEIDSLINRYKWHRDNDKWQYSMEYYLADGLPTLEWVE